MNSLAVRGLGLLVLLFAFATCIEAEGGIPIVYGWGEEVTYVKPLPPGVREQARNELGHDAAIGFLYSRFHIFWLDLWTWGGRHVLYADQKYWDPGERGWEELLGKEETAKLSAPILYRFPLGFTILVAIVGGATVWSVLFPSRIARGQRLLKDERYQKALKIYFEKVCPPAQTEAPSPVDEFLDAISGPETSRSAEAPERSDPPPADAQDGRQQTRTEADTAAQPPQGESPEVAFAAAVRCLRDEGIPADVAEKNFDLVLVAALAQRAA
jgi:hypothetical protein